MNIRQGDVLLVSSTEGGDKRKKIAPENGRIILARGEATGHNHSMKAQNCDLFDTAQGMLLVVREITPLTHPEHAAIEVAPGTYWVVPQREYTPEAIRRVRD